ncbi:MAG TPA: mechanosensitive ion channel family protein [Anaerolineae bacterium]|nr:mechanosensitive ion channel family protein [Anaerolineae bacterium]
MDLKTLQDWLLTSGLLARGGRILIILLAAWLGYRLLGVVARRIEKLVEDEDHATVSEREQRARTLTRTLRSTGLVLIAFVAGTMILRELGMDIGPILAGAGIVGLAVGFGAQTLVRDVISGFFILLENQFNVGDSIQVGDLAGSVEKITLRATFLRDLQGTLHIVPNGEIRILSNRTRGWARALVNVGVAYEEEIDRALAVLERIGQELWGDEHYRPLLLEEPTVTGVEELGDSSVVVRIMARTQPGKQWDVARVLRKRIKETFEQEGIEMPYPRYEVRLWPQRRED